MSDTPANSTPAPQAPPPSPAPVVLPIIAVDTVQRSADPIAMVVKQNR